MEKIREDIYLALAGAISDVCCEAPDDQLLHVCKWLEGYADAKESLAAQMEAQSLQYVIKQEEEIKQQAVVGALRNLTSICDSIAAITYDVDNSEKLLLLCESLSGLLPNVATVYVGHVEGTALHIVASNKGELIGRKTVKGKWKTMISNGSSSVYVSNVVLDAEVEYLLTWPKIGSLLLIELATNYLLGIDVVGKFGIDPQIREAIDAFVSKTIAQTNVVETNIAANEQDAVETNIAANDQNVGQTNIAANGPEIAQLSSSNDQDGQTANDPTPTI